MTLIVTFGDRNVIVSAADSVLTQKFYGVTGEKVRSLTNVQKLFACDTASCIVSSWGEARLRPKSDSSVVGVAPTSVGDIPIQLWLEDKLADCKTKSAIDLANDICNSLNAGYIPFDTWAGFDFAFFDDDSPSVIRVSNGESSDFLYGKFECGRVVGLRHGDGLDDLHPHAAGESNARKLMDQFRLALNNGLVRAGSPELKPYWLRRYARVIVRSVADAMNALEIGKSVGGPVWTATLQKNGAPRIESESND